MAQPEDRIVVAYHRKKPMRIVVNVSRKRSRTGSPWRTRRASTNIFVLFSPLHRDLMSGLAAVCHDSSTA